MEAKQLIGDGAVRIGRREGCSLRAALGDERTPTADTSHDVSQTHNTQQESISARDRLMGRP
jgi:hypothetical protein